MFSRPVIIAPDGFGWLITDGLEFDYLLKMGKSEIRIQRPTEMTLIPSKDNPVGELVYLPARPTVNWYRITLTNGGYGFITPGKFQPTSLNEFSEYPYPFYERKFLQTYHTTPA